MAEVEEITHLDFPAKPARCAGFMVTDRGRPVGGNNDSCPDPAVLRSVFGCCPASILLCQSCYEGLVGWAAKGNRPLHTSHYASDPLFSSTSRL